MRLVARPIDQWPGKLRPDVSRAMPTFTASWSSTVDLLEREVDMIAARGVSEAAIQLAVVESDLRLDGWIRANARPAHPGVIVAFESKYGPLRYHTDYFASNYEMAGWQANVRAVALGLEALRRVDRYGITKDGEQYKGWNALPAGTPMRAAMTVEEAALFIAEHSGWASADLDALVDEPGVLDAEYRRAAKRLHPDVGGDPALFRRLQQARELLEAGR